MTRACRPLTAWRRLAAPLCAAALLAPVPAGADTCSTLAFGVQSAQGTGTAPVAALAADFNRDGKLDLVTANAAAGTVSRLLGDGSGGLGPATSFAAGPNPTDVVAGDLDRDGLLDLVVASSSGTSVSLLRGLSGGSFAAPVSFGVGSVLRRVYLADFNRDGRKDLVAVSEAGSWVRVFAGNGTIGFGAQLAGLSPGAPAAAAPGDFNADGKLDLAVALRGTDVVAVYLGDGTGFLGNGAGSATPFVSVPTGVTPLDVAAGDLDRDGKIDLVTADSVAGEATVMLGNGNGNFTPKTAATVGGNPVRVALVDLDRDGALDLVALDDNPLLPRLAAFRGSATPPTLFDSTPYAVSLAASSAPGGLAIGDLTSDGRPDLATALSATDQALVVPNLSGTGCTLASFGGAPRAYAAGDGPVAAASADFDGDGRSDLVVANEAGGTITVLKSAGGGYGPPESYPAPTPRGVATGDFNFDGFADVVAALGAAGQVQVFLGNGAGVLAPGFSAAAGSNTAAVVVGDFDGNGSPDVAAASEGTNQVLVFLGNGAGNLGAAIPRTVGIAPRALVAGFFNADTNLDLAVACSGSGNVWVLLGNGDGTFVVGPQLAVGAGPWSIAAADLDASGTTDLVTADHGADRVSVLKGNGNGTFAPAVSYAVDSLPTGVALLRVDDTARPDIVVSTASNHTVNLLLDDGTGGFNAATRHPARLSPQAVVPVDVDADGRLDVAVPCRASDEIVVFLTRPPSLQSAPRIAVGPLPQGAASADLDGDGDLDLAVANTNGSTVSILLNDGTGTFTPLGVPLAVGSAPTAVVAADFDRDGILDLAATSSTGATVSVLRGLGGATFAGSVAFPSGSSPDDLVAADVDRDGDLDLLVCNKTANTVTFLENITNVAPISFATPGASDVYAVGNSPTSIFAADFDRDGQLDFAVANDDSDSLTVRYGDGTGLFPTAETLPLTAGDTSPLSVTGADFDGDGDVDLATVAFGTEYVSVFENLGTTFLTAPDRVATPSLPVYVTSADVNRDGKADLAVTATGLRLLRGKGSLTLPSPFEDGETSLAGLSPGFVLVADFNRDGWPDAAVLNGDSGDVSILLSTSCSARRLDLSLQPATCGTGLGPYAREAVVRLLDDGGNTVACATGTVTPGIVPGTGDPTAVLGGSSSLALTNGIASFVGANALTVDKPGRRYRLQFGVSGPPVLPLAVTRSFTLGAELALLGPSSICPSSSGTYATEGSYDEYVWTLTPPGSPFAYTPSVLLQNPPLSGAYTLGVSTRVDGCVASATSDIYAGNLQSTSLAVQGVTSVCVDCIGGTLKPTDTGGGAPVSRQWGYRTASGVGVPVSMPGEAGETYTLKGSSFPGSGSYWVVVTTQPTCGTPRVSSEIPITVITSVPTGEVQYLGAAARGSGALGGQVQLQWVNSTGTADEIRVRWNRAPNGTGVCVSPPDTLSAATDEAVILNPPSATTGGYGHTGLVFDTAYCYSVFVKVGAVWSPGRTVKARPFNSETGPVRWSYSTGGTAVVPPVVGKDGLVVMSNDRTVHALTRGGPSGGVWPANWVPRPLAGVAHSRSPIVPFSTSVIVAPGESVLFVGDDSGDVRAFNARTGQSLWGSPTPPNLGTPVTGAPGGLFQQYGGIRDVVLVGTRDGAASNALHGLDLADGSSAGSPFTAGGTIGAISGTPAVDYTTQRVYFASRSLSSGPTLWCVQVGTTPLFTPVWSRNLGDIDGSPVLRNGRVYVGTTAGTIYSLDAATGLDDRTFSTGGDGPVKGFLFPDRRNTDLMFATNTTVWSISDNGSPSMGLNWQWTVGGLSPSVILYWPQTNLVYVGSRDGKLYELDFSLANPRASDQQAPARPRRRPRARSGRRPSTSASSRRCVRGGQEAADRGQRVGRAVWHRGAAALGDAGARPAGLPPGSRPGYTQADPGGFRMSEGEDRTAESAAARPDGRLPYQKPAVAWEQPLEAQPSLMSGCQKQPGGGPDCTAVGPVSS